MNDLCGGAALYFPKTLLTGVYIQKDYGNEGNNNIQHIVKYRLEFKYSYFAYIQNQGWAMIAVYLKVFE